MNEENNISTSRPDFAGEEMKMPENMNQQPQPKKNSPVVLVVLTVLLLLVLGGLYMWFSTLTNSPQIAPVPAVERPTDEENNEPESNNAEAERDSLNIVSSSDELSAIEADLESTNLGSLDAELTTIDAEIESASEAEASAQ